MQLQVPGARYVLKMVGKPVKQFNNSTALLHLAHLQFHVLSPSDLAFPPALQEPLHLLHHRVVIKPEKFVDVLPRQRMSKAAHVDTRVRISLPAQRHIRLNDHSRNTLSAPQHLALVAQRLGPEQRVRGETDNPRLRM